MSYFMTRLKQPTTYFGLIAVLHAVVTKDPSAFGQAIGQVAVGLGLIHANV